MYKLLAAAAVAVCIWSAVTPAQAHPGGTTYDGTHECRTNCEHWGYAYGERHRHASSSASDGGGATRLLVMLATVGLAVAVVIGVMRKDQPKQ